MKTYGQIALAVSFVLSCGGCFAGWQYSSTTDPMTSKTTKTAVLESSNSLNLGAPYAGQNNAEIFIRSHPTHGLQAVFRIGQGQLMCSEVSGCPIKIRFDDNQPITFSGVGAADHNPTIAFINNPKKFIEQARKAKKVLVQMNIFHNGAPVLEFFSPEPLDWK